MAVERHRLAGDRDRQPSTAAAHAAFDRSSWRRRAVCT
jgi:hypothetical protein